MSKENSYWVAGSSLVSAVATISCCILPLLLVGIGVSGAWVGNLTALMPYQPYFIGASLLLIGYGFFMIQARRKQDCATGTCAKPLTYRGTYVLLFISLGLVASALAFPWYVKFFS